MSQTLALQRFLEGSAGWIEEVGDGNWGKGVLAGSENGGWVTQTISKKTWPKLDSVESEELQSAHKFGRNLSFSHNRQSCP